MSEWQVVRIAAPSGEREAAHGRGFNPEFCEINQGTEIRVKYMDPTSRKMYLDERKAHGFALTCEHFWLVNNEDALAVDRRYNDSGYYVVCNHYVEAD